MSEFVELCGTLEKQIYKSPENGFSVFSLKINSKQSITIQGYLPQVHQGENVTLKGKWSFHKKYGRQFLVEECAAELPSSAIGIQKYLASGLVKGIGPKFAERLVAKFGDKTLEIIDKQPEMLNQVSGVGPQRVAAIQDAWHDQKEISKVMVFLKSRDVATSFAIKIYKTYGDESLDKIQENPYRLVEDIWGIGFKSADKLAIKLGIEKTSIKRIKSGILHSITEGTSNGHLYFEVPKIKANVVKILELEEEVEWQSLIKRALHDLYDEDKIKLITHNEEHFISLPKFYFSEKNIAKKIENLLKYKTDSSRFDLHKIYNQIKKPDANGMDLNEEQQKGILSCLQSKITIITGGPGTGKTTLIKKLLEVLKDNKLKFKLAAPTGRAAKRMFEGTGCNTETLHRMLEFNPTIMNFNKNERNALDIDFLIVDEASMIDVFLMNSLLKAIPFHAHIVFLGDIDQLPSVGAGNILKDLINSEVIPTTKLTQIFRQAQDSLIIVNAHKINNGEFPTSSIPGSKRDFFYIKENEPEDIFPILHKIYKTTLPKYNILPSNSIVLTPMNRGIAGTQRINQELQMLLNPEEKDSKQLSRFGQVYRLGDRVMQIRNNYDKFVFNGDLGTVHDINQVDQKMFVSFGDRVLEYDFAELDELVLSYAISIHKSQGSEFGAVIIPIFMQHFILLQRNLIYTAITRAKKLCILIGQPKAIAMGIKNNKGVERNTFLKEFLTTDLEAR